MNERRSSRRSFLSVGVTAVVVAVVAGIGGYYYGLMSAPAPAGPSTITKTLTQTATVTTTVTATTPTSPLPPKPDKITLMTWGGPASVNVPKVMDKFSEQYDVPMALELQAASAEGLAKMQAAWPRAHADIFSTIPAVAVTAQNEGFLVPISETEVPHLKDIPDSLKIIADGKVWAVASWYSNTLWMWNKERFPKGLKALSNLLDPALKNRITASPISGYAGGFVVQLAYARGGDEYNMEPGWQFMKELAEGGYIRSISRSDQERTDALVREEAWAAWTTAQNLVKVQNQGAPIEGNKIYTDSKTPLDPVVWCITNGPNQEWAKEYLNFFLEPNMLSFVTQPGNMGTMPSNSKIEPAEETAKYIQTPTEAKDHGYFIDPFYQSKTYPQWAERWEKEILPLLG